MSPAARTRTAYFCADCGNETARWQGQCPACDAWNTLVEEPRGAREEAAPLTAEAATEPVRLEDVAGTATERWLSGLDEFDFVLGGGLVPGSLVLVGGEPGIGKSTLLLQVAARLEAAGRGTLYVSGEESAAQTRLRADRLSESAGRVTFLAETRLEAILARARALEPAVLFVDSIQTVRTDELEGAPGSVGQVRECAARLQREAKETGTAIFLVGHVTKGGMVAGPKTLEHIVDTVLYFEGAALDHRVLRATKNRFGAADELGVFRMGQGGLEAVANPSELFLRERAGGASGSAVVATIEGTRPLLVEVQALCSKATYGAAQRVANGFDRQRLTLLLAVLERRAGIAFGELDVFLNVAGGVRLADPAADLAVAAALGSAVFDRPLPPDAVFLGEIGLGGEVRAVSMAERRVAEAGRMGFRTAYLPGRSMPAAHPDGIAMEALADLAALGQAVWQ